jgi:hypothetical protein
MKEFHGGTVIRPDGLCCRYRCWHTRQRVTEELDNQDRVVAKLARYAEKEKGYLVALSAGEKFPQFVVFVERCKLDATE